MHRLALFSLAITATLLIACTSSSPPTSSVRAENNSSTDLTTQPATVKTTTGAVEVAQEESSSAEDGAEHEDVQPVLVATADAATETTEEAIDWLTQATADGSFYILGNPNAPIRLVDYSDFL